MRAVAIVQARMGSTRLPGKVLREIAGRPLLTHVLERAFACKSVDQVVVATTDAPENAAIVETAKTLGVPAFVGSRNDVLDRYYQAAQAYGADVVVRLTADCPLLDPAEVDRVVHYFLVHPELDYAALGYTYPEGYGAEVFSRTALERAWQEATLVSDREHVTSYIQRHPDRFRMERLEFPEDLSRFRVTVDEEPDLQVVSALLKALAPLDPLFGIEATTAFLKAHPEIASINSHVARSGYWKTMAEDKLVSEPISHPTQQQDEAE